MEATSPSGRILIVDLGATFGGAEIYLENLLRQLPQDFTCHVLCANPELQKRLAALQVRQFVLPRATGAMKVIQLFAAAAVLPYLLIRHRIQTVQINGYAEIILIPLSRLLGRRAVATRHLSFEIETDHWHQAPGRFAARFLYRRLARFATRIICVSREVGREVSLLIPPERVTVIPNSVSTIPPYRSRVLPPGSPVQILFVGRMVENKGLQVLLEAMRHIEALEGGRGVRLIAVGEGQYRSELERRAVGLDAQFVGFQADVAPFYLSSDIFVSPSLGPEGSSLVALEAMAHCVPCVLSDLAVHREISNNGEAAILFHNGDVADLALKLRMLMDREERRQSYLQAAYSFVRQHHHPDLAAKAHVTAFSW
jgi:glycosyltransferase involved in cell wall biosynthesis